MDLDETTIKSLTTEELMKKLETCGERSGPITPTTRSLYEKRLLKRIRLNNAAACSLVYSTVESPSSTSNPAASNSRNENGTTDSAGSHGSPNRSNDLSKPESVVKKLDENSTGPFYGVRPPPASGAIGRIFTDRLEALKYVKQNANSRFKSFTILGDAESFCANVEVEPVAAPSTPQTPFPTKSASGEGSPFKSVRTQELVALRKMIETGDAEKFKKTIWSNPRYLVGSGDTPTILQEGSRYNAMHVCAQKNQAEICSILVDTIEDPTYLQLMYPDSKTSLNQRIDFLVDLFLNTPDKNGCESPLHFACKHGCADVVAILAAHPRVDRELRNKYGETAAQVICSRMPKATASMKEKIEQLLDERYYVRLFRNDDQAVRITKPWSPCRNDSYLSAIDLAPDSAVGFLSSPREAPMAVRAYAGPMSKVAAEQLYNHWTASPQRASTARRNQSVLRRNDPRKGYERIGRELSAEVRAPWREYWAFLDTYTDLRREEGLRLLENHLDERKRMIEETEEREKAESDICDMFGRLKLQDRSLDATLNSFSSITGGGGATNENILRDIASSNRSDCTNTRLNGVGKCEALTNLSNSYVSDSAASSSSTSLEMLSSISDKVSQTLIRRNVVYADSGVVELGDSDDESDAESFVTAADDITMMADLEEEEGGEDSYYISSCLMDSSWSELVTSTPVFIEGDRPSSSDTDVLRTLDGLDLDVNNYPLIVFWRNRILSYPEVERNRWPLPRGKKAGHFESIPSRQRTGAERLVRSMSGSGEGTGLEEEDESRSPGSPPRSPLSPDTSNQAVCRTLW